MDRWLQVNKFITENPDVVNATGLARYLENDSKATLFGTYVHLSNKVLSFNTEIEHIQRLSEYLWAIGHNYTNSAAYQLVTKTHFDYGLKTHKQLMTELVFPFYTFKMRNLEYWIDMLIEKTCNGIIV